MNVSESGCFTQGQCGCPYWPSRISCWASALLASCSYFFPLTSESGTMVSLKPFCRYPAPLRNRPPIEPSRDSRAPQTMSSLPLIRPWCLFPSYTCLFSSVPNMIGKQTFGASSAAATLPCSSLSRVHTSLFPTELGVAVPAEDPGRLVPPPRHPGGCKASDVAI